jgi:hypothetical protein
MMYAELKRKCMQCKEEKLEADFYSGASLTARTRSKTTCYSCQKLAGKERSRIYRARYPEKIRDAKLKCYYGISLKIYNDMLDKQGGVCAICGLPQNRLNGVTRKQENLVVDHDHKTGQVRALLCHKCNMEVGTVELNIARIQRYLDKFKK